ncbi:hypothetical protein ScPMuIL_000627 [Solemya velum]
MLEDTDHENKAEMDGHRVGSKKPMADAECSGVSSPDDTLSAHSFDSSNLAAPGLCNVHVLLKSGDLEESRKQRPTEKRHEGFFLTLLSTGIVFGLAQCQTTLKAKISMAGITGTVTLTQNGKDMDTSLTYSMGALGDFRWEIHEFRTFYSQNNRCASNSIGGKLDMLTGTQATSTIPSAILSDLRTLSGRSIVLNPTADSAVTVCATLEEESMYVTSFAKFPGSVTIAGTIVFRQPKGKPTSVTSITSDLFFVNGETQGSSLRWQVYAGSVTADIDQDKPLSDRCDSVGSLYNPSIGDLSQKHGNISVAATRGGHRNFFSDLNLPLSGNEAILNKSLVIFDSTGKIIACSNIVNVKENIAKVTLSRSSVKGSITFHQQSIFDPTTVKIDLKGLGFTAGSYQIYEWPVPQRFQADEDVCSSSRISETWNPLEVSPVSNPQGGTDDQFQMGDLSGKFGPLDNEDTIVAEFEDWNLPLSGPNSIVGRSLGINFKNGSRRLCGNIDMDVVMVTALATFHYPVIGFVLLRQPMDDWYFQTQVYMEFDYGDGTMVPTSMHKWGFHEQKASDDFDGVGSDRCKSTGTLYNPYGVSMSGDYSTECSEYNQLRCGLGDMAGKHGTISVRSAGGGRWKKLFTDINLPLSGPKSVIGRSLVIGKSNLFEPLSCANVVELQVRKVLVNDWSNNQPSNINGVVDFTSSDSGFLDEVTSSNLKLHNLQNNASGFHVHNYPVISNSEYDHPCDAASVGGHFNPFGINVKASPTAGTGSDDEYELGDLSGKYGKPLDDLTDVVDVHHYDTELPLRGPYSIVGKSIVLHKKDSTASRWVCGNILEDVAEMKSKRYVAEARFHGEIEGAIHLSQYMYEAASGMSDTEILLDIKYKDGHKSAGHEWRIYEMPVGVDGTSKCQNLEGVYTPHHANKEQGYGECGLSNPLRCMLGDASGKQQPYEIGSGRKFYTDVNLPIYGPFSVVGRSFVILSAGDDKVPLGCADILPYTGPQVEMHIASRQPIDKTDLRLTIAQVLHTDTWNVATEVDLPDTSECKLATLYFMGPNATTLKEK